jgi:hypothetical protein
MSKFTQQHYRAIAEVMQEAQPLPENRAGMDTWEFTVDMLGQMFTRDDPNFKRERFERACVPGANVRARS